MTLIYYYMGNLFFQICLAIILISLISRYNPRDHRSVIFQRLIYAGLAWAAFDLLMGLNHHFLTPAAGFRCYGIFSFMFVFFPPLAIQLILSLIRELTPREKFLIFFPYLFMYGIILVFPDLSNAQIFNIPGGYGGRLPPWNTGFKVFSLGIPLVCVIILLRSSLRDEDPVVRKEKQLLAWGAIAFMAGILLSQALKQRFPALPWFANLSTTFLSLAAFFSLKKYGRVLSGQTLFETTVRISPNGISHILNSRMIWTNQSMQALLNQNAGPIQDVREIFHENQPPGMSKDEIISGICKGSIQGKVVYVRNMTATPQACLINCAPLESGKPENGVLMILTDVSEENRIRKELSELNLRLEEMAHIDSLTQIANRRRFDAVLTREWQRSERTNSPLSLILLDVDFFKSYNDRFGHQMGDVCLQRVARKIAETLNRSGDLVCRFGGEEFAVILLDTPLEGAVKIARQINENVEGLHILHPDSEVSDFVTLSSGVSCANEFKNKNMADIIGRADSALYTAKANGRNRFEVSGSGF